MNKTYIPSLIIFFKGFTITCLGVLFHFMKMKETKVLLIIGPVLIAVSVIVFFIMKSVNSKKKNESLF